VRAVNEWNAIDQGGKNGKKAVKKRFGDVPNVEMECSACLLKYSTPMQEACPEWDKECKMKE
jgi:hypothetical protein